MHNKTIQEHIPDFLKYCEVERGLSKVSVKNYSNFLASFVKWLDKSGFSRLQPHELKQEHVWDYRIYLSAKASGATRKPLSKHTQGYYLIALRSLLSYFSDKEITSLPPHKVKLPKQQKRRHIKFLQLEQLKKLLESPDINTAKGIRDRALLETFFSTGMRIAELVSLNVSQFSPTAIGSKKDYELTIIGKGSKPRVVYFSQRCLEWIKKYLGLRAYDQEPALFSNLRTPLPNSKYNSRRLTSRSIERIIKYYAVKSGSPLFTTPHTLRHTYATDLLSQGVDLRAIQEFLGHQSITTTEVYTHVTNKRLGDIHKKFHSGSKLEDIK